jgi:hypothetical protein
MGIRGSILALALGAAALTACNKAQPTQNNEMSIDDNLGVGDLPANADIETLPPDESSVTSNGELVSGNDNPDVNEGGNSL